VTDIYSIYRCLISLREATDAGDVSGGCKAMNNHATPSCWIKRWWQDMIGELQHLNLFYFKIAL